MSNQQDDIDDGQGHGGDDVREQDKHLPIANIIRIMKKALPPNAKVARDAKDTVQDCVSEFISFITSEASERCLTEKRKTINGDDIISAMNILGFDNYTEPLKAYLQKYRDTDKKEGGNKKGSPKKSEQTSPPGSPSTSPSPSLHHSIDNGQLYPPDQANYDDLNFNNNNNHYGN